MLGRATKKIGEPPATVTSFRDCATEQQLVAAAKSGDELAFESLFKRHQQRIFVLAFRYTRVREDAEDILQQTFQKAFVHLQKFEERSSLSTWLTRIAINQALILLRKRRTMREVPIDDSSSSGETTPPLELADARPDPEVSCFQTEGAGILSSAIGRLKPAMRRAIQLRELRELSVQETAEHMGVSVSAVKANVFRARRKLGQTLTHYMRSHRMRGGDVLAIAGKPDRLGKSTHLRRMRLFVGTERGPFCRFDSFSLGKPIERRKTMKSQNVATNAHQSNVPEERGKNVPTLDEIHRRAQEIHIEHGDHDRDLDNYLDEWLQAERELREKLSNNNDADPRKK